MEFKYGELYKCENGDVFVVAHDPFSSTMHKIVKINRFVQERENELQEYLDSFIGNDHRFTITWIDKSGKKIADDYKLIMDAPYI